MAGKRPDYDVSVLDKDTEERGRVGAGWINDDGSISIKLNPFVVLQGPNIMIRLFPSKDWDKPTAKPDKRRTYVPDDPSDDIPF